MAERAPDRLLRLLGMIAYLDRHDGVPVDELARQFGVTPQQALEDIDTLWVTGTPGYLPYDLIDFDATSYEEGVVRLTESRGMTRPLRLGAREGVALVAALRLPSSRAKATASCAADSTTVPQVWLVDALGTAVRPQLPTDACGQVRAEVRRAVDRLETTDVVSYPVALVTPSAPAR